MTPREYDAITSPLLSNKFHIELVQPAEISGLLTSVESMSGRVGAVKKALYYGKTPREDDARWLENMADHSQTFDTGRISPVMLHTALGVHEEGGEMLRMLASVARGEQEFDKTNWLEELGDALWFVMAGARAAGFTLEEVMEANITKLKKRYHDKFDAHRANNRDIASEREALENV